jgi:hypothetical protein
MARAPGEGIHAIAPATQPGARRRDYTSIKPGVNGGIPQTEAVSETASVCDLPQGQDRQNPLLDFVV